MERGTAALAARDWEAFSALKAPELRHYDRTRIAQLDTDGQQWLAEFRRMVAMTSEPPVYRLLATRGERLALFEMFWRGAAGDVGPSEIEWRLIVEVNERGEHIAIAHAGPTSGSPSSSTRRARASARSLRALPPRRFSRTPPRAPGAR